MMEAKEKITFTCNRELKEKLLAWAKAYDRPISYLCEQGMSEILKQKNNGSDILAKLPDSVS